VIVEEVMTQTNADVCVMTADGLSAAINIRYYSLCGVFFFRLEINAPCVLETHYSAKLYTSISLCLKQQHSIPVLLSAVPVDLLCHQTIDSSNEHVTAD
jgi:hypothetical protein